jgi:hypothetical protein
MTDNLKEKVFSSRIGQIGLLIFSAYTFAWGIIEPLVLNWINENKKIWRIILLAFSGIITAVLSIRLSRSTLEQIDG